MDRRAGLIVLAAAACRAPAPQHAQVIARGTLAYGVCFAGDRLVTVELGERFALVVRDRAGHLQGQVDLGPPERDWPALACAGERAYVGGVAGSVDAIDLATRTIDATWPIGAPVTALAAAPGLVAIGDATGVLCLRADTGELLQCVAAHDNAIDALMIESGRLTSRTRSGAHGWTLPGLAAAPPAEAPALHAAGAKVLRGAATLVTMSGPVHAIAESAGIVAVAAWITRLDQPSVVLIRSP